MSYVHDLLANPDALHRLYGKVPDLSAGLRVRSVNRSPYGPTLTLRVDLPGFPARPPQEWMDAGADTVQCHLAFLAVENVTLSAWTPPALGRLTAVPSVPRGVTRGSMTMTRSIDRTKSLEQLDGERWGDPPTDATSLVRTVHEWRRRPIGTLEPHELARLIGQNVGLPWLLPLALDILGREAEEQAAGGFLDGDLLYAVVTRGSDVWDQHPDLARELKSLLPLLKDVSRYVKSEIDVFLASIPDGM
ncbi:contact-dependent growth inhibition system immunity protein [Streptomyces sp. NPDC049915]|uniref:contact-dependent growth inhibition system immunity protein n=1 Tax=Streptomyces sp. NPDC049915 TaxID=3155510 RepID=UPI00342B5EBD